MQDKIKEQFEKVLTNKTGTYYEITQRIYDFIDQNFIGKEEMRGTIRDMKYYPSIGPLDLEEGSYNESLDKLLELIN